MNIDFRKKKKKNLLGFLKNPISQGLQMGDQDAVCDCNLHLKEVPFCGEYLFLLVDRKASSLFPKVTASISNATTRNPIWAKMKRLICLLHHYNLKERKRARDSITNIMPYMKIYLILYQNLVDAWSYTLLTNINQSMKNQTRSTKS